MFFKKKDEVKTAIEFFKKKNGTFWRTKLLDIWKEDNYKDIPNDVVDGLKKAKDLNINLNSY